jgi:putative sigma-54 modulation protein
MDVTPDVRDYVEKKVDRLRKVFNNIQQIHVVLSNDGKRRAGADLVVEAALGVLKCAAKDESALAAFDLAMDKMERQLGRHKARISGNKKHPRRNQRRPIAVEASASLDEAFGDVASDPEDLPPARPVKLRRMSLQEAFDAFERSGYHLLAFLDEESGRSCILHQDERGEVDLLEIMGED